MAAHVVPCVVGTPVQEPTAVPIGLPCPTRATSSVLLARGAQIRIDTTGDGLADSLGLDTTGDGWVDTVQRLQRVDTRQTQHSAASEVSAIADQERKRRAGRQFNIEVAQVGPKTRYFIYC